MVGPWERYEALSMVGRCLKCLIFALRNYLMTPSRQLIQWKRKKEKRTSSCMAWFLRCGFRTLHDTIEVSQHQLCSLHGKPRIIKAAYTSSALCKVDQSGIYQLCYLQGKPWIIRVARSFTWYMHWSYFSIHNSSSLFNQIQWLAFSAVHSTFFMMAVTSCLGRPINDSQFFNLCPIYQLQPRMYNTRIEH